MKIRNGFVSNSSSSSFILISGRGEYNPDEIFKYLKFNPRRICRRSYTLTLPVKSGCKYFGRNFKTCRTLADKLNLVTYFILDAENHDEWERVHELSNVLEEAILTVVRKRDSERGKLHRDGDYCLEVLYDYNYIHYNGKRPRNDGCLEVDHQSDIRENMKMFDSVQDMYNFLFNDESAIYVGSDELYPTFEYEEGAKAYREINGEYPWTVEGDEDFLFEDHDILRTHEWEKRPDEYRMFANSDWASFYKKSYVLEVAFNRWRKTSPFIRRMKREGKWDRYKEYWDEEWKSYRD